MVRAMRESGTLGEAPAPSPRSRMLLTLILAAAFGASAYLLAIWAVPHLPELTHIGSKPATLATFVRPN
jgi:hypothetical protein